MEKGGQIVVHRRFPTLEYISVENYKSIKDEVKLEIKPLTVFSGANSSGKSSFMQPILLLKQTIESNYDPGPLKLNGPNVIQSSFSKLLSQVNGKNFSNEFSISIGVKYSSKNKEALKLFFTKTGNRILLSKMKHCENEDENTYTSKMKSEDIEKTLSDDFPKFFKANKFELKAERCFFKIIASLEGEKVATNALFTHPICYVFDDIIRHIIHLPGLRGNPERLYPLTSAEGEVFPGIFSDYVATLIDKWKKSRNKKRFYNLNDDLLLLGLTSAVNTKMKNDTEISILVSRTTAKCKTKDYVNIADVGFGVSQTLPVLVALNAAQPGQIVYLEQPEIHLHPKAQFELTSVINKAIKRGVNVILETHSPMILIGIQTLVAKAELDEDEVVLHWFERNKEGFTSVKTASMDELGRYGDWPNDFGKVELGVQDMYLDAVFERSKDVK